MTHAVAPQPRVRRTGMAVLTALCLAASLAGTGGLGPPVHAALTVAQAPAATPAAVPANAAEAPPGGAYEYDPAQRRDPFNPLIQSGTSKIPREDLPPLQRVGVTEISLIGVVWGGFGYTAMVQTPDGKGYAVRRGTRIGPNNGVVSKISENSIVVTERFTDLYGKEQEREYVKLLHSSEDVE